MAKKILSKLNLEVLKTVKRLKKATTTKVANAEGISFGGASHHLEILKKAGKIARDKKTLVWSVK